eukprot:scaffold19791_cov142-Amphora_coffeaeformis.AAC.3
MRERDDATMIEPLIRFVMKSEIKPSEVQEEGGLQLHSLLTTHTTTCKWQKRTEEDEDDDDRRREK